MSTSTLLTHSGTGSYFVTLQRFLFIPDIFGLRQRVVTYIGFRGQLNGRYSYLFITRGHYVTRTNTISTFLKLRVVHMRVHCNIVVGPSLDDTFSICVVFGQTNTRVDCIFGVAKRLGRR